MSVRDFYNFDLFGICQKAKIKVHTSTSRTSWMENVRSNWKNHINELCDQSIDYGFKHEQMLYKLTVIQSIDRQN